VFTNIRWRLVGWNVAVFGVILLIVGGTTYAYAARRLPDEVDRDLAGRAAFAFAPRSADREELLAGQSGYRGGYFFLAVGPSGDVLDNPQQVAVPALPPITTDDYDATFTTVQVNGEPIRLYIRPLPSFPTAPTGYPERKPRPAAVVVGQSLVPMQNALRRLLIGLISGGLAGGLLLVVGAWFLAGRALVPIETAFRRQQEFIADASHELRTPMTVLRSSADLLDRHRAEPLAANGELFDDLRDGLVRLERLATDLLTLARSDLGEQQLDLAVAPLDLATFAADVARRTTPLARAHGLILSCEAAADEVPIEADPDRLHQVLLILLDNAIAHTPPGGTVTVTVARQGGEALIAVGDTGEGIAPDHLERIFDRFYRADSARSRSGGGAGLGLAIAKALVELHGGTIALASTPGQGTTATIHLPLGDQSPSLVGRLGQFAARVAHRPAR
jgi:two-component system, OmpR family, sensor histidine kinase CiaH